MNIKEFALDDISDYHLKRSFCAIIYCHDSTLTTSVYVLDCSTPEEAETKAWEYFDKLPHPTRLYAKRIDILPKGSHRYATVTPVFTKSFGKPSYINHTVSDARIKRFTPEKVELFNDTNLVNLEAAINKFLEKGISIVDRKMAQSSYIDIDPDTKQPVAITEITVSIFYKENL